MEKRVENVTDLKSKREPKEGGRETSVSYRGRLDFLETVTAQRGRTIFGDRAFLKLPCGAEQAALSRFWVETGGTRISREGGVSIGTVMEEDEEEEKDKTVCGARLKASALLRLVTACTATPTRHPSIKC